MKSIYFAILVASTIFLRIIEASPCCMCGGCFPRSGRERFKVDSVGTTCTAYILHVAEVATAGSSTCSALSRAHYDRCCTNKATARIPQQRNGNGGRCKHVPYSNVGPLCHLCHDKKFPQKPSTVTAILGVSGNPSCATLYCMTRRGHISDQLCNPLQDFMDIPCGCYSRFNRRQLSSNVTVELDQNTGDYLEGEWSDESSQISSNSMFSIISDVDEGDELVKYSAMV